MSGQINPREYDLGELRDAVRETSRRDNDPVRSNERPTTARESTPPVSDSEKRPAVDDPPSDDGGAVSATEDPEAYLRSRHRRGRFETDEQRGNARNGRHSSEPPRSRDLNDVRSESTGTGGRDFDFDLLSHRSEGTVSRPYLDELPGTYSAQLEIFEWLNQLVSKAGEDGAISALEYYESIEWLSEESRTDLEEFVAGLGTADTAGTLGMSDHRKSLTYIARLAGRGRR